MVVNTRAMVKAQKKVKDTPTARKNKEEVTNLVFWKTDRPSEVNKILKIKSEVKRNGIEIKVCSHNYNKQLGKRVIPLNNSKGQNGSQEIELALLDICQIAKKFNRDNLAISVEDKLFEHYSQLTIKEIETQQFSVTR